MSILSRERSEVRPPATRQSEEAGLQIAEGRRRVAPGWARRGITKAGLRRAGA